MVRLTRRVSFSSGHRYWLPNSTEEENHGIFGRWASPYYHGHNYTLDVETAGTIDPKTGMVVNIKDIDSVLQSQIVSAFNQRSLNDQVPEFTDRAPTLENLLLVIRGRLEQLPEQVRLTKLTLQETDLLFATWTPEAMTLTRSYEFAASHRLHVPGLSDAQNIDLFGKCNNPAGHGHNYVIEVTIGGEPDPISGMLADLESLDAIVEREIVERYDHRNLNSDLPELQGKNPTSEVVAREIFDRLAGALPYPLISVKLHETARNAFEVRADER